MLRVSIEEKGRMKRKIYTPVTDFERATSYCPLYLAWRILPSSPRLRRGRRLYRERPCLPGIPSGHVKLRHVPGHARKALGRFRRSQTAATGRDAILTSMRQWLAGVLAQERPALFRDLPESFKIGHPLPQKQGGALRRPAIAARYPYQAAFRPRLRTTSGLDHIKPRMFL
jgi:hypothetical protein